MKNTKLLSLLLTIAILITTCITFFTNITYAKTSKITMDIDKTNAGVGDIIVVSVKVENITGLATYQVNIKYDPEVLQAVDPVTKIAFGRKTFPDYGTVNVNNDYKPFRLAENDIDMGIINFSSSYMDIEGYRKNGVSEESGILGKIGFKVLKVEETSIRFEETERMPNSIEGTYLFDWNYRTVTGYNVEQPALINRNVEVTPTPTPTPTLKPTSTNTAQPTPTPTKKPINGYIEMDLNETYVQIGDIITATIKIKNIENISAYQLNIKYDPRMLKAVDPKTGKEYNDSTFPSGGTILMNDDYLPLSIVSNNIAKGIINFSKSYLYIAQYKESGKPEETGIICKIGFKALRTGKTSVKFSDAEEMPGSILGTFMFDWNSKKIVGYSVYQPDEIRIVAGLPTSTPSFSPTPKKTPSSTPRPTRTPTRTTTPRPTQTPTQTPTVTEPEIVIPGIDGKTHYSYLSGYPDGSFKPEKKITRAEAAVIFANLLGANENTKITGTIPTYTDLDKDHWATWAIQYVSSKQLFSGYPDGSFKPNRNITRAEFSTVVFKLLKAAKSLKDEEIKDNKFKDTEGHWARQNIEQLAALGYINGYPDGTFMPDYNIKRAESVALINRALQRGPLKGATKMFPDVPETHWAFEDIAEGAIDHTFVVNSRGEETLKEILSE
ncbi:MAG: cell surface protein [Clostridium sp.]|nr:cell surface protein [Clostridium sp.]